VKTALKAFVSGAAGTAGALVLLGAIATWTAYAVQRDLREMWHGVDLLRGKADPDA
jgi:hypothetical protein